MSSYTENGIGYKDMFSLAVGFYGLYQQRRLHDIELNEAKRRHKVTLDHSQSLTDRSLNEVKRFYLLELFNNLEQHFQQLNADLIASCKEAERDMFDQRNQSLQTIILSSSVMFAALTTAITNGTIPEETETFVVWIFGIATAIAFCSLFLSIVLCIETVIRASLFMYRRAQTHTKHLQEAIRETKNIMAKMRIRTEDSMNPDKVAKITKMSYEQLEEEFYKHEEIIREYLSHRVKINDKFAEFRRDRRFQQDNNLQQQPIPSGDDIPGVIDQSVNRSVFAIQRSISQDLFRCLFCCFYRTLRDTRNHEDVNTSPNGSTRGAIGMTFNEFWEEKCQVYATWAFGLFYLGTGSLLSATSVYVYATFHFSYHIRPGAIAAATIIGVAILLGMFLAGRLRKHTAKYNYRLLNERLGDPPAGDIEQGKVMGNDTHEE